MAVTQVVTYPFQPVLKSTGSQRKAIANYVLAGTYATGGFATTTDELGIGGSAGGLEDVDVIVTAPMAAAVVSVVPVLGAGSVVTLKLNTAAGELANLTSVAALGLQIRSYRSGT